MTLRKFSVLLLLAVCAGSLLGADPSPNVRKVFEIKYADMRTLEQVLQVFLGNNDLWRRVSLDRNARRIAINLPEDMAKIVEDTITRLDVPAAAPRNLELTAWFITASDKDPGVGVAPPPELERVIAQLRNTFAFKNYRLMDALVIRTRAGEGVEASGTVGVDRSPDVNAPPVSQFKIRSATVTAGEKGNVIRIDGLHAGLKVPVWGPKNAMVYVDTGINGADIDIGDGQKVVVGKSSMDGPDKALIVVLSAKVL